MYFLHLSFSVFLINASIHCINSDPTEVPIEQILGYACCIMNDNDEDQNAGITITNGDHPDCGRFKAKPPSGRIFQGVKAYAGQFPWFVLFYTRNSPTSPVSSYCGGAILDKYHVITAAHCVYGRKGTEISMAFGVHNLNNKAEIAQKTIKITLKQWQTLFFPLTHQYVNINGQMLHESDLAIVRLHEPNEWLPDPYDGGNVNGICWRSVAKYKYDECQNVTFAGFGLTFGAHKANAKVPQVLQTGDQRICHNSYCIQGGNYEVRNQIWYDNICTARRLPPRSLTCEGDSGSAVVHLFEHSTRTKRGLLVGIVTHGDNKPCHVTVNNNQLLVGRHKNCQHHLPWITGVVDRDEKYDKEPEGWTIYILRGLRLIIGL